MNIVRTHPYGLLTLQQQINRMFDQFDQDVFGRFEELGDGTFAPPMDVKEDSDAYIVHLEVPGVPRENIDITLHEGTLTIRGTREKRNEETGGEFRRIERAYGSFARSVTLPRSVDAAQVQANLADGVLEVRLPKSEAAKPRQISIGSTVQASAISESGSETKSSRTLTVTPGVVNPEAKAPSTDEAQAVPGQTTDSQPQTEHAS